MSQAADLAPRSSDIVGRTRSKIGCVKTTRTVNWPQEPRKIIYQQIVQDDHKNIVNKITRIVQEQLAPPPYGPATSPRSARRRRERPFFLQTDQPPHVLHSRTTGRRRPSFSDVLLARGRRKPFFSDVLLARRRRGPFFSDVLLARGRRRPFFSPPHDVLLPPRT